jgi:succinoglycan biosynthesis protein ExoA
MSGPGQSPARAVAIVPCLNESSHIDGLIVRLLDDPGWVDPLVVVADGGSTDGALEIVERIAARDPRVRLVHNPKRIQAAAINLGAALFGADRAWLVRVDAHCRYPRGYVSTLVAEAVRTGAASVVVSLNTRGRGGFQRAVAYAQNSRLGTGGAAHRARARAGFVDHGHHALMDMSAFRSVGGYDERFSHNEDAELDVRLRRNHGQIWLTDAAEVVYFPRAAPMPLFLQYTNYGRGRARTLLLHRQRPRLRQLLPLAVAPAILCLAGAAFWPVLAAPAAVWAAGCCLYGVVIAAARRDPSALLSGPAAMTMHAGWSLGFWAQLFSRPRAVGSAPSLALQAEASE